MEAVWRTEVEDVPTFVVANDMGHDFGAAVSTPLAMSVPLRPGPRGARA